MSTLSLSYQESDVTRKKTFLSVARYRGGKTAGIDTVRRNYVTITLRIRASATRHVYDNSLIVILW